MELISYLVLPSGLIAVCLLVGLVAGIFRRSRRLSHVFLATGGVIYLVLSFGPVSYALLKPLEFKYDAYPAGSQPADVAYIVVMAGYALDMHYYPLSSKANATSIVRLVEAVHLWRSDPSRQIVVSGYKDVPEIMARVLVAIGVPEDRVIVDNQSFNSYQTAINTQKIIQGEQFILVTSAGHMPRCMAIFGKLGLDPIPAPTDYMAGKDPFQAGYFPTVENLRFSELAIHEYIGIL